ncbi:hypothetical protein JCM8097_006358 [Rhodosporidiobolus ruineniae]
MAAASAQAHPFSAASKPWAPPDFSKDSPRRRKLLQSPSQPTVQLAFPPDEEKGRSLRTNSLSAAQPTSGLLPAFDYSPLTQHSTPTLFTRNQSTRTDDGDDDDAFLDSWRQDGGAQGEGETEALANDPVVEEDWREARASPRPQPHVDWTKVLDHAVTKSDGWVDLSGRGLTEVPNSIWELSTLVSINNRAAVSSSTPRSFARTQTVPAAAFPGTPSSARLSTPRSFGRTSSGPFGSPTSPTATKSAVPINLILSANELTAASLSNALWTLSNLQSLSLRRNQLEHLPEGIGRLSGLTELNVAGNALKYLPAEVLQLTEMKQLSLHPNPFLPPPAPPALPSPPLTPSTADAASPTPSPAPSKRTKRVLGPLTTHRPVPSLFETCVRRLLSPLSPAPVASSTSSSSTQTLALDIYDRNYLKQVLSGPTLEPFVSTLYPVTSSVPPPSFTAAGSGSEDAFTRGRHASSSSSSYLASSAPSRAPQPFDPLSHVCRSPSHPLEARVFREPCVERIEWVSEARLQPCAPTLGGGNKKSEVRDVPVRWRGCGARCLDWLEEDEDEEEDDEETTGA